MPTHGAIWGQTGRTVERADTFIFRMLFLVFPELVDVVCHVHTAVHKLNWFVDIIPGEVCCGILSLQRQEKTIKIFSRHYICKRVLPATFVNGGLPCAVTWNGVISEQWPSQLHNGSEVKMTKMFKGRVEITFNFITFFLKVGNDSLIIKCIYITWEWKNIFVVVCWCFLFEELLFAFHPAS